MKLIKKSSIKTNIIYNEDCLTGMKRLPDKSIDMILCDLPYGRTKNRWDKIIPFNLLWEQYTRIIKDRGAIVLFADGLFMADLMNSNRKMWKYNIVWDKVLTSGFLNANIQPLRVHEEMVVFYKKQPIYNPQKTKGKPNHSKGKPKECVNNNYGKFNFVDNNEELGDMKHPTSIWRFQKPHPSKSLHPTEKPIDLCVDLIKTFTTEGNIVLDNCVGSGSTLVACIKTNRKYIGFEIETKFYDITNKRLKQGL